MMNQLKIRDTKFDLKRLTGLLISFALIFILCSSFLPQATFVNPDWKPALALKWDSRLILDNKVDVQDYFWLASSSEERLEALRLGVREEKIILDLRSGLQTPDFHTTHALFTDSLLAEATVGRQVDNAWLYRRSDRNWQGFAWKGEIVDHSKLLGSHYLNASKVILVDNSQLESYAKSSNQAPQWYRKFLPASNLIVIICFMISGILIHPMALTGCLIVLAGTWLNDLRIQLDLLLVCALLSLWLSHWKAIFRRRKVGFAEVTSGILYALYFWPLKVLLLSGVIYLSAWHEDLGSYFYSGGNFGLSTPYYAIVSLALAYLLLWVISFFENLAVKFILSLISVIFTGAYLSIFQEGQVDFFTLWIVSVIGLGLIQLVMVLTLLLLVRIKSRKGIVHLGYFGFGNLGDDLLLVCQLKRYKNVSNQFVISASYTDIPILESKDIVIVHRQDLAGLIACLARCDSLSLGPGGILQDKSSQSSLLYYLSFGFLARFLGCKWYWQGQGFSPLRFRTSKWLTWISSKLVSGIEVRDKASRDCLISLGVKSSEINVTRDLVWELDYNSMVKPKRSLAVVLRDWPTAPLKNWIKQLQQVGLKRQYFLFEKDRSLEDLIRSLDPKSSIYVYKGNWRDFLRQFSLCSHVLSMRYHGLVLGRKMGKNCLSLAYDEKCKNLQIESKFVLDPNRWQSLFPTVTEFVETI